MKLAADNLHPFSRSRITNGAQLLPGVSGRSVWARRLRDLVQLHTADKGGDDELSEAQRAIVRRAAVIQTELEYFESQFALLRDDGRVPTPEQLDLYARLSNSLRRLLEAVGIQRRAKDISPQPRSGALDDFIEADAP